MEKDHSRAADIRLDSLSDRLRVLIGAELERDERVRWIGRPLAGRLAFHHSGTMSLLGFALTLMIVLWMAAMHLYDRASPLWGLPFLVLGLGLFSSPWWALRRARQTAYLITDRRALAFHAAYPVAVHAYSLDNLGALERRQRADGSGDLAFSVTDNAEHSLGTPSISVGFLELPDVRAVERLLREDLLRPPSGP